MRCALLHSSSSRCGISATGSTMSTMPVAMAARGMPSYSASSGICASVTPPVSFTRVRPTAPSLPVPDSTTQMARSRCTSRQRAEEQVDRRVRRPWRARGALAAQVAVVHRQVERRAGSRRRGWPRSAPARAPAAPACACCAAGSRPRCSRAWATGAGRRRTPCRCAGICAKNCCSASSPPAEAPIPTTGKFRLLLCRSCSSGSGAGAAREDTSVPLD